MKGHLAGVDGLTFKDGDKLKVALHAETTDKILVFTTSGKIYTLGADKLPGGRGHGEPLRIMVDMENDQDIVSVFVHSADRKLLLASSIGRGFVVAEKDIIATTRKGKQVLNVKAPDEAYLAVPVEGDYVAVIGKNRKLLVFPVDELPEMGARSGGSPSEI